MQTGVMSKRAPKPGSGVFQSIEDLRAKQAVPRASTGNPGARKPAMHMKYDPKKSAANARSPMKRESASFITSVELPGAVQLEGRLPGPDDHQSIFDQAKRGTRAKVVSRKEVTKSPAPVKQKPGTGPTNVEALIGTAQTAPGSGTELSAGVRTQNRYLAASIEALYLEGPQDAEDKLPGAADYHSQILEQTNYQFMTLQA